MYIGTGIICWFFSFNINFNVVIDQLKITTMYRRLTFNIAIYSIPVNIKLKRKQPDNVRGLTNPNPIHIQDLEKRKKENSVILFSQKTPLQKERKKETTCTASQQC